MTRCQLMLMLAASIVFAGCTDNIDTVTREYRAANTECIDALMMVTNEAQAKRMTLRIFKPMNDRYGAIDKKLTIVIGNRTKGELVKEVLESDYVHLYRVDLELNTQRYDLERLRLKRIVRQLVDEAGGNANPKDICPFLLALVFKDEPEAAGGAGAGKPGGGAGPPMPGGGGAPPGGGGAPPGGGMGGGMGGGRNDGILEPLRKQLMENDLEKKMSEFPSWKIANYREMYASYEKRHEEFMPKERIVLVK